MSVEWALVEEFIQTADLAGLHIPEDTQLRRNVVAVHSQMLAGTPEGKGSWPPFSWLSAVALAQHYGIATRLLDWTWKPKVAAYFAAIELANGRAKSDELAVWALDSQVLRRGTPLLQYQERPALVTAPYDGNPNLAAQSGVFTVDYDARDPDRPFEHFLSAHLDQLFGPVDAWSSDLFERSGISLPPFQKLTLPSALAPQLLRCLAEEHISAATIFPGYGGVAESLAEQLLWDKRPWARPSR